MSKLINFYWEQNIRRTLEEIKRCALKIEFSCQHQPLLDIPLANVVLDELYLMLRITGKYKSIYIFQNNISTLCIFFCNCGKLNYYFWG